MSQKRPQKSRQMVAAIALSSALVMAACGSGEGGEAELDGPAAGEEGSELDHVGELDFGTIAIPAIYSMVLTEVAEEVGFFEKYGVDVNFQALEAGVDAARAVQGGDLDLAWSPTGPVVTFAGTGVAVSGLLGMDNIDWLVGSTNPDVQACEDLAGETIAVDSIGGARYSVLEIILDSCDLSIDDVETPSFPGPSAIQAVAAGQLDTSVIHIDDLYVIEEQGEDDLHVVEMLADVDPTQHYLMLWALDSTVEEKHEELVRAIAAMGEAARYMQDESNHDAIVDIASDATGHSEEVARLSLADFLELEFWPVDRHGLPEEGLEATIAEQVRLGNIPEGDAPEYEDVVALSVWDEAHELIQEHGEW